jgi:hypothetical protein
LAEDVAVAGAAAALAVVAALVAAAEAEEDLGGSVAEEVSAVVALADPGDAWLE